MEGWRCVNGKFFKEHQDKNLQTSKTKKVDKIVVPEDRIKYASKNGAILCVFLRSLENYKTENIRNTLHSFGSQISRFIKIFCQNMIAQARH